MFTCRWLMFKRIPFGFHCEALVTPVKFVTTNVQNHIGPNRKQTTFVLVHDWNANVRGEVLTHWEWPTLLGRNKNAEHNLHLEVITLDTFQKLGTSMDFRNHSEIQMFVQGVNRLYIYIYVIFPSFGTLLNPKFDPSHLWIPTTGTRLAQREKT